MRCAHHTAASFLGEEEDGGSGSGQEPGQMGGDEGEEGEQASGRESEGTRRGPAEEETGTEQGGPEQCGSAGVRRRN